MRRAACPGLESLGRGKLHRIFGNGPGAGNQETRVEDNGIEKVHQTRNENEIQFTYPDRALMLRFLVVLLRARVTEPPLEGCPEGAPLVSAWCLKAGSADNSVPAAASPPRIGT